jgi:tetratricopeptide (TPR) repeat protein
MKRLSSIVPGIFMIVVGVVAAVILYRVGFAMPSGPSGPSDRQTLLDYNRCLSVATSSGAIDTKALQKCGELLANSPTIDDFSKARMDEMRWMLTIIGSLAAFFVIAQSASAFFTAQSYTRSADDALARMTAQEAEIRARYPVFAEVEKARQEAYADLRTALKNIEDRGANDPLEALAFLRRFYIHYGVQKRQRLLSVESFASVDLDPNRPDGAQYAGDLRRLGFFYQSKFLHEDGLGKGVLSDLERAESYLRMAFDKSADFTILNDLGNLYLSFYNACGTRHPEDLLQKAESEFLNSLKSEPNQQRAHYNLGVLEGKYRKHYHEAIVHLRNATREANWERFPVTNTQSYIYYNLGCYIARELSGSSVVLTVADGKELLESLHTAASFHRIPQKLVKGDFEQTDGDIFPILGKVDTGLNLALESAKQALLAPPTPATKPSVFEAITGSWKLLRSALFNQPT